MMVAAAGAACILAGMFVYNIDHVAIAVEDLNAATAEYERLFGAVPVRREVVEEQGVEEAMIAVGGSHVQLLQPLGPDTAVGRFLDKNGEGLHHIALAVADIDAAMAHLSAEGAKLVDREPRPGGNGTRIAFVHPRAFAGTLIELVELP